MRFVSAAPILALAVAGCVAAPPPPAPPIVAAPPPVAAVPVPVEDWRDWPLTPGTWRYAADSRGTRASYAAGGGMAAAILRCDRGERRLYVARAGADVAPLTIRTTSVTRALAVQPAGGSAPYVESGLAAADPLLDAIAFSRGRFTIEQPGASALVLPAWAELGRVIEDCRG